VTCDSADLRRCQRREHLTSPRSSQRKVNRWFGHNAQQTRAKSSVWKYMPVSVSLKFHRSRANSRSACVSRCPTSSLWEARTVARTQHSAVKCSNALLSRDRRGRRLHRPLWHRLSEFHYHGLPYRCRQGVPGTRKSYRASARDCLMLRSESRRCSTADPESGQNLACS